MSTDTKPRAWYVDVAALVDQRSQPGDLSAFDRAPRRVAQDLLSALAAVDRIAYYSTDYDETSFQLIDNWLDEHHFPDGVMYLAWPGDDRGEMDVQRDLLAGLHRRFELRGYVIDSEDVLDGITITDCVE